MINILHNISLAEPVTFPNASIDSIKSPNNSFAVKNNINFQNLNDRKFLTIQDLKLNIKDQLLINYDRNVDVSWSEDSRYVFVNDNFASNMSNCLIFPVSNVRKRIDISNILKNKFKALWGNHHIYVNCAKQNKYIFNIDFHGYGDISPDGFDYRFKFDLNKKQIIY